ncbi:MAG: LptF/LptG family permease [Dysgonomonas sp.]|nr:LptF/LptG family permease [Dysgonomonas sp.]
MLRIKRLYLYILQTFVPVFFMTFAICLFIIIMQFLWKYVEDLVGKGLETHVLAELFFYVTLTLVPMALPLAILLASLMTFGNLGERYELVAIKASGISLLRAMRPLIVLIIFISIGAFIFQNNVIPVVQVKFRALMISIRQKSPELDIPENTFYSGIDNYNLYIQSKNKETGMLYDVMIYDTSKGFDNMSVIVSDSGKLEMSLNKDYLMLTLFGGQDFRNFQQSSMMTQRSRNNKFVPYSRENFKERRVIIPFDANFNRMDEASMDNTQISKNIYELRQSIDSLDQSIRTMNVNDRRTMLSYTYLTYRNQTSPTDTLKNDSISSLSGNLVHSLDSVMGTLNLKERERVYNEAMMKAENNKNDFMFRTIAKVDAQKSMRRHDVELQRKFVLSFACLVFFFIGAPLGAIIRKGGLGMPVIISVILFIIYYIIDNVGYKMARDGVWEVWQGVWLSSFVLFPLGAFITYKAINDSALFNPEAYGIYLRKVLFITKPTKANEEKREAILNRIPDLSDMNLESDFVKGIEAMDSDKLREIAQNYKDMGYDKNMQLASLSVLKKRGADLNTIIDQQDSDYVRAYLNRFVKSSILTIIAYLVAVVCIFFNIKAFSNIFEGIYIILYVRSMIYYFNFYGKVDKKNNVLNIIISALLFVAYPVLFLLIKKRMGKHVGKIQII